VDEIFGYTGRFLDDATAKQWNLNRWYDAPTGRWMSEDPIGFGGNDTNLHRYGANGVTNAVDPDGLWAEGDIPPYVDKAYDTLDDAATAWGLTYNSACIKRDQEFASALYVGTDGKIHYSPPLLGQKHRVSRPWPTAPYKFMKGDIHSHGAYSRGYDNNKFSPQDLDSVTGGNTCYLATPNGSLLKAVFKPGGNPEITLMKQRLQFDPNDPTSPKRLPTTGTR
jgi:RHS repeat-associated protein